MYQSSSALDAVQLDLKLISRREEHPHDANTYKEGPYQPNVIL